MLIKLKRSSLQKMQQNMWIRNEIFDYLIIKYYKQWSNDLRLSYKKCSKRPLSANMDKILLIRKYTGRHRVRTFVIISWILVIIPRTLVIIPRTLAIIPRTLVTYLGHSSLISDTFVYNTGKVEYTFDF